METYTPTGRTQVNRLPKRAVYDKAQVYGILDAGVICHVGFATDGQPYVIPTGYARLAYEIYIHGSAASRMLRTLGEGLDCCVTVTLIDGFVLARSAFHHSMNYRSVVILGKARFVTDPAEKMAAMRCFTNHIVPGRWEEVRAASDQELRPPPFWPCCSMRSRLKFAPARPSTMKRTTRSRCGPASSRSRYTRPSQSQTRACCRAYRRSTCAASPAGNSSADYIGTAWQYLPCLATYDTVRPELKDLMQTMNISLPEQLKEFVDNQVGSGRYSSVSEYVRDLIRDDEKRKAREKLEALLMEGIQSGPPTEMTRRDWDDIRREALKQFEVRKSRKKA